METILAKEFFTNTINVGFLKSWLTDEEMETIYTTAELYAKGKCKEQRELCSHALTADIPKGPTHNLVLYAPEPKFDLPEVPGKS
jgi:hypothetical protein